MATRKKAASVPVEGIAGSIIILRGHRVLLDANLAAIYGVEIRALNQAVKRNSERFPEDFCFSAICRRGGSFKITICDLEDWPWSERQIPALCLHRTRCHTCCKRIALHACGGDGYLRRACFCAIA
jgi:hypothetical protein